MSGEEEDDDDEATRIMPRRSEPELAPESARVVPPESMRLTERERRELQEAGTLVSGALGGKAPPKSYPGPPPSMRGAPTMSMREYAALLARLEKTTNESYVLREHNLTPEAWASVKRAWNRLSRDEPKVARALRRALADARLKVS